jgi:large subunit ribosomal protein L10
MKKIGLIFKEASENRIKNSIKTTESVFILRYSKLSSPDLTALRRSLVGSNANFFVVKNSVAKRAFKDSGLDGLIKAIEGPCGLVFIKEEPVAVSKIIANFSKDHDQLKVEGGIFKDMILKKEDIDRLARLPGKEFLRAQVVMTIKSPLTGLAAVLNNTLRKFVICLDQIKQKKGS